MSEEMLKKVKRAARHARGQADSHGRVAARELRPDKVCMHASRWVAMLGYTSDQDLLKPERSDGMVSLQCRKGIHARN